MKKKVFVALVLLLSFAFVVNADQTWTGATNNDWATASNWSGAVPTVADIANISYTINGPVISSAGICKSLYLGLVANTNPVTLAMNAGGSLSVSGATTGLVRFGCVAGAAYDVDMTGGTLYSLGYIRMGHAVGGSSGTWDIAGTSADNKAEVTTDAYLAIGFEATAAGTSHTMNLGNYGKITTTTGFVIGRKSVGILNMTGGEVIGNDNDTGLTGKIVMGEAATGAGTWIMSGGTATAQNFVSIGYVSDIEQLADVSGGTITTDDLDIGRDGTGRLKITGSAATIQSNNLFVGSYTGFNGKGTLEFKVGASGVTAIQVANSVVLDAGGAGSVADLIVSLEAAPLGDILLVNNTSANAVIGLFDTVNGNAATEGALVVLTYGSVNYNYSLTYQGGAGGNDIMLTIPEPATLAIFAATSLVYLFKRRR